MSAAGIYGEIVRDGKSAGPCLLIGKLVPRLHHADGIPVYLLTEDPHGVMVTLRNHERRFLLAYPSAWPRPGGRGQAWLYAKQESLPFDAVIPLFDRGDA